VGEFAAHSVPAEDNGPSKHDELSHKYCLGWALASVDYCKEIKALYAGILEKEGWQGDKVRELREGKWNSRSC